MKLFLTNGAHHREHQQTSISQILFSCIMPPVPVPVASPPPPPPPPVPPPPPPALPGGPQNVTGSNKSLEPGQTETKQVSEEEFIKEIIELVKRLPPKRRRNDEDEYDQVILVVAIPLKTVILQNGPMCGLVALAEALEMLNMENKETVSAKALLDEAIQKGYTKQGEMFSVRAMQSLAEQYGAGHVNSKILRSLTEQGPFRFMALLRELIFDSLKGRPILFPYDADHNHTPSLRKGHAAHWAVIHGLANFVSSSELSSILHPSNEPPFQILHSSPTLVILKPSAAPVLNDAQYAVMHFLVDQFMLSKNTHVISHQGKSFHTALWKYVELFSSNSNLKEVAPKILENPQEFILLEGIEEGLCSQILVL